MVFQQLNIDLLYTVLDERYLIELCPCDEGPVYG